MLVALRHRAHTFRLKDADQSTGEFSGYGSVFDVVDSYGEAVQRGAFAKTLASWSERGRLPMMLWQHRADEPIGLWTKMVEDDHGLYVEGRILVSAGPLEQRVYEHLRAGTISGLSIGFDLPPGGASVDKASGRVLLHAIDLWELSIVSFPANPDAEIDAVKAALAGGPKEIERLLREAGFSRSQAKGLLARGYDGLRDLREAGDEGAENETKAALEGLLGSLRAVRG